MNKRKERAKGFIAGVLLTILLSGAVTVAANAVTQYITVTFRGIRIVVDGEQITPRDGHGNVVEPFIWNGTTYLPVRAVAEAVGQDVRWDGATSTVYLTSPLPPDIIPLPTPQPPAPTPPPAPRPQSLFDAIQPFESGGRSNTVGLGLATVTMMGNTYANALRTWTNNIFAASPWEHRNLNRQYTTITGTIGRTDGSGQGTSTITFLGDGIQLASFSVDGNTTPTEISVDVTDVSVLRIQFDVSGRGAMIAFANAMIE
ncbi:MAG: copper amine oxidase N-terminal domain-containing protein [Defluviitaleaceae bacterium]|nr:copper amine oxidase N-terminal domain-containing protein [Defluviitaleaceae bacterium]MCL2263186.1 copper amine oxidase N-terminal domain-containing protein [Defluviitaleaceae bacterium]